MGLAHGGRVIAEDYFALINTKIKELESRLGTVSGDISGKIVIWILVSVNSLLELITLSVRLNVKLIMILQLV